MYRETNKIEVLLTEYDSNPTEDQTREVAPHEDASEEYDILSVVNVEGGDDDTEGREKDQAREVVSAEVGGSQSERREVGKDGDVALFDGDPFEYTTHCVGVVINGKVVSRQKR